MKFAPVLRGWKNSASFNTERALIRVIFVGLTTLLSGPFFCAQADVLKDSVITARIETAYMLNDHLSAASIITKTKDGVVSLNGSVDSEAAKSLAEDIAASVNNVTSVNNQLVIVPPSAPKNAEGRDWRDTVDDLTVTTSVRTNLLYHRQFGGFKIGISTKEGVVSLTGTIPTQADIDAIINIVSTTKGVKSVKNGLKIGEPGKVEAFFRDAGDTISDETAEQRVRSRLFFNREMEDTEVVVSVVDNVCTLSGTVGKAEQKTLAENVASTVPGIESVKNTIAVQKVTVENLTLIEPDFE